MQKVGVDNHNHNPVKTSPGPTPQIFVRYIQQNQKIDQ